MKTRISEIEQAITRAKQIELDHGLTDNNSRDRFIADLLSSWGEDFFMATVKRAKEVIQNRDERDLAIMKQEAYDKVRRMNMEVGG